MTLCACVYKNRIIACMIFFSVCDDISMSQLLSIIPVLLKWLKQRKCFMAQACAFILIPIFLSLCVQKAITVTTKYRFSPSSFLITEKLLYWIAKYMKEIRYLTPDRLVYVQYFSWFFFLMCLLAIWSIHGRLKMNFSHLSMCMSISFIWNFRNYFQMIRCSR